MKSTTNLPSLAQIHDLVEAVPDYPVLADELVELARTRRAGSSLVDFFGCFAPDVQFFNADDLTARAEMVGTLKEEGPNMPLETLRSPQS